MAERICIVGCGAIGGLFAAALAQLPEVEVWALDSSPDHVNAINRDGLRLTGAVERTVRVHARTDPGEIPPCPLGIVATKGTVTVAAIAAAAPVFADAAVCSVQNGIGNEELIAEYVPRVIRGVTLESGGAVGPGVIHADAPGPTWIGPFEPSPATPQELAHLGDLLARAGMQPRVLADARGAQWTKVIFNAATNPLCALTGLSHGALCRYPPTLALVEALIAEAKAVAQSLGIMLDEDPSVLNERAARVNPGHRPSMLQDVTARRRTEIDTLNGGIVDAGRRAGVPTPLNAAIADLIRGLEHSWTEPSRGDGS